MAVRALCVAFLMGSAVADKCDTFQFNEFASSDCDVQDGSRVLVPVSVAENCSSFICSNVISQYSVVSLAGGRCISGSTYGCSISKEVCTDLNTYLCMSAKNVPPPTPPKPEGCFNAALAVRQKLAVAQDFVEFGGLLCTRGLGSASCRAGIHTALTILTEAEPNIGLIASRCSQHPSYPLTRDTAVNFNTSLVYLNQASTVCAKPGQPQRCVDYVKQATSAVDSTNYGLKTALEMMTMDSTQLLQRKKNE